MILNSRTLFQRAAKKPEKEDKTTRQKCSKGFCLRKDYSKYDKPEQRPIDVQIKLDSLEVSLFLFTTYKMSYLIYQIS